MARSGQTSVYTGPLFLPKEQIMKFMLIGNNELAVPTNFFKIAIVEYLNDVGEINYWIEAFVLPNEFNELMSKKIEEEIPLYKLNEKLPEFVFNCRNDGYKINSKKNSSENPKRINIHNLLANYSESVDFIEQNSEFRILTEIKKSIKNLKGGHKFYKDTVGEYKIIKEKIVEEKYLKEELENFENENEEDEVLEDAPVKEKLNLEKEDKLIKKNNQKKKEDRRQKRVSMISISTS